MRKMRGGSKVERPVVNGMVGGSSPSPAAKRRRYIPPRVVRIHALAHLEANGQSKTTELKFHDILQWMLSVSDAAHERMGKAIDSDEYDFYREWWAQLNGAMRRDLR